MPRRTIDLTAHLNQTVDRGGPADFPVALRPVFYEQDGSHHAVANRLAVVREDTGEALAVVSDRYTLVPHQRILDLVHEAITRLDVGPVPRGIYVDRRGARLRALFKFPSLKRSVSTGDDLCPCLKVQNTYDGTSRILVHVGAFRFVCTNLAVGGGGVFAGGFMAVHAGNIPIEKMAEQLSAYLAGFESIAELYRLWSDQALQPGILEEIFGNVPKRPRRAIREEMSRKRVTTVFEAYNAATHYATHKMRSYHGAFDLLERINCAFQRHFPPNMN